MYKFAYLPKYSATRIYSSSLCRTNSPLQRAPLFLCSSVCAIIGATHELSVVNLSDKPVDLRSGTPIAAISFVTPLATAFFNSAALHYLPCNEKFRKVLNNLHFDAIKLDAFTKLKRREMIDEFIDVVAECDSDVGSTNVVFHKIDTGVSRPFRQPAPRIPYGVQRDVV